MSKKILLLAFIATFHGCGEVKVVKDGDSSISQVNPANEFVKVHTNEPAVAQLDCLRLVDPIFVSDGSVLEKDRAVFARASKAHLAPLNYRINTNCPDQFELRVKEYKVQEIVIASRVIVDVEAEVKNGSGLTLWKASYRLTENAGSVPFDPISVGIGAVSAARNSSDDSKHNAVYLAVRRLLMAMPENTNFAGQQLVASKAPESNTFDDALKLWSEDKKEEAMRIAESLYRPESQANLGYQYGLMLEASGRDFDAAVVYSETAISQLANASYDVALRTLRRLDRLNQSHQGEFDEQLSAALEFVKARE